MIVFSRQRDESVMIGDGVEITIVEVLGDKVRLGVTSPKHLSVHRREIYDAIQREKANQEAGVSPKTPRTHFSCGGAYGGQVTGQIAYIEASESGNVIKCERFSNKGYCVMEHGGEPRLCPFGIEKKL